MAAIIVQKEIFEKQYRSMRIIDLANFYGISPQAVHYLLRKHKIPKKGRKITIIDSQQKSGK